jgi:hypothetical protein
VAVRDGTKEAWEDATGLSDTPGVRGLSCFQIVVALPDYATLILSWLAQASIVCPKVFVYLLNPGLRCHGRCTSRNFGYHPSGFSQPLAIRPREKLFDLVEKSIASEYQN